MTELFKIVFQKASIHAGYRLFFGYGPGTKYQKSFLINQERLFLAPHFSGWVLTLS
jgi:hypothetical protein